jgi:hypothetical protein
MEKRKMKKLFIILSLLFLSSQIEAKNYNHALGLRGLFDGGITYKQFLSSDNAFEIVLSGGEKWYSLTGTYQWHNKTKYRHFEWYYGIGAHVVSIDDYKKTPWDRDVDNDMILGVNGIIGAEYALKEIPIVFSLDFNPTLNLIGDSGLWLNRGSFSIRFYW